MLVEPEDEELREVVHPHPWKRNYEVELPQMD